jgi:hypothetical protein
LMKLCHGFMILKLHPEKANWFYYYKWPYIEWRKRVFNTEMKGNWILQCA